ncbi:molybdopterin synthase catalytic subunit-like isoform X2 [Lucilia sericata]|uniref:molybdopterin synthase catalytic subunit-like isoform X2 n=1 Tax=Lucilia sericata TaxID=13632 RepID=UPI0018A8491B|nr:molybdopterin synthase catalytic subunit-like isoform X2 [Lucilia sericata]
MNHLILTRDILNVGEISDTVSAKSCGAISLFVGTTRDCFEGKRVCSLEYEAYEPMAIKQIELICKELRRQWPDIVNIAICHRLGLVEVREASVVIAISSPHRKTSLDAVGVAIDELKKRVPIWKKEIYDENESTWKENKELNSKFNTKNNKKLGLVSWYLKDIEYYRRSPTLPEKP